MKALFEVLADLGPQADPEWQEPFPELEPPCPQKLVRQPCKFWRVLGDAAYWFALPLGEIKQLEAKLKAGVGTVMGRIGSIDCRKEDLCEVIRYGLIGGGLTPAQANAVILNWVADRPMIESWALAIAICRAAWQAPFGESFPKYEAAAAAAAKTTATDVSTSPASTSGAASSDSLQPTSMSSRSGNSNAASPDTSKPMPAATISPNSLPATITTA